MLGLMTSLTKDRYEQLAITAPLAGVTFENVNKAGLLHASVHPTRLAGHPVRSLYPVVLLTFRFYENAFDPWVNRLD